ncbi:NEDD8 activating enzyme [Coemansia sp. RSA 2706]|nr:NEDD8 activating enzyme [Coemansia sp. RSA 2711]KAJ2296712.1 NEDD8 activating enzyme [Coemansia sp. RSA 2706]KAJ2298832.1 NEDD8 activating enzyme [Coemansia sp. RSA 2705]KAJ2363140.1 NEDD8 activating enzyme [Coemansia sp. RSA 2610]
MAPTAACTTGIERFLTLKAPHVEDFELVNEEGETPQQLLDKAKILVIGAGGLGCEILKDLVMSGFKNIHVIDMDTIDISNLNRQFLFRKKDVGKPKAEVAAEFIRQRTPDVNITAHYGRIQDMPEEFYLDLSLIVCGLDSIEARRWINGFIHGLVESHGFRGFKPIIDGGTEGLRGNMRVILPKHNACFECGLDMYPPKTTYPICTIANTPRLPEHCIEWASVLEWPRVFPDKKLDGDDADHINWVVEQASQRAASFNIAGITFSLAQGVVKNIIPAIASTNAIVAAACVNEAVKLITSCNQYLDNSMLYTGDDGVYFLAYPLFQSEACIVCGQKSGSIGALSTSTLEDLITALKEHGTFQLKAPSLTFGDTSLYFQNPKMLEEQTRPNLAKSLKDLFDSGSTLTVTDPTLPTSLRITVNFTDHQE